MAQRELNNKTIRLIVNLVLEILVLLRGNFDKNAYFDIFFAYSKFGTRNCMRSYFWGFIFSTGIFGGVFENFDIFCG